MSAKKHIIDTLQGDHAVTYNVYFSKAACTFWTVHIASNYYYANLVICTLEALVVFVCVQV